MFRAIIEFLALLLFFAVARSVISTMMRIATGFSASQTAESTPRQQQSGQDIRSAGELRKDPVCGTFVPIATSLKRVVGGEMVYFCSPGCRDKFRVPAAS